MPHGTVHAGGAGVFGREDELALVERVLAEARFRLCS
jgi:hypothetical protein